MHHEWMERDSQLTICYFWKIFTSVMAYWPPLGSPNLILIIMIWWRTIRGVPIIKLHSVTSARGSLFHVNGQATLNSAYLLLCRGMTSLSWLEEWRPSLCDTSADWVANSIRNDRTSPFSTRKQVWPPWTCWTRSATWSVASGARGVHGRQPLMSVETGVIWPF